MLHLRVLDETHVIYEGRVRRVHFEGTEGEFEVAQDHAPILSLLKKGVIRVVKEAAGTRAEPVVAIPIQRGIVKLEWNRILAMVEPAGA